MLDYRNCSIEEFEAAMKAVGHAHDYSKVSTEHLFIAYTKYRADVSYLKCCTTWACALKLIISSDKKAEEIKAELARRGFR